MTRARLLAPSLLAAALVCGSLVALGTPPATAADPGTQALTRLDQDADGALTIRRDGSDAVEFVGVPASAEVDNPTVTSETGVAVAADRHLARYGAAVGADQPGTTLERTAVQTTLAGDVVRYQQQVDGVPVVGGDVVVGLREDGELSSVLAHTSDRTALPAATVSEAAATAQARAAFEKSAGRGGEATVESQGRWLLDASLIGGSAQTPDRTVWRFEVTRGAAERRQIMVDDRTGGIVINVDEIQHAAPRVVCNNNGALQSSDVPCTTGYTGTGTAAGDVKTAFDLTDVVATFYQQIGVLDLASLLGITTATGKRLASTVGWCYSGQTCPYKNAFWNGKQMYYGAGYAGADDVVGHEITHGVTERSSGLFYWGQSGAINESISDILGEIIDQRNPSANDAAKKWLIGEDVPGFSNGLRNMADPAGAAYKDPDRMSSAFYVVESCEDPKNATTCYPDSDGVHANSGVGNKTAYLISQGGTFNGQTIAGIDAGDATLTKSAKLWLLVDQSLSSGSDYADVATVLDQSCQGLLARRTTGFTAATCANVHKATLATELRLSPTKSPHPADAPASCPTGTTKRVLFSSESGDVTSKLVPSSGSWNSSPWRRDSYLPARSGVAWTSAEPTNIGAYSLVVRTGITLPARQRTYLHFQQWRLLDFAKGNAYDAGTVEVDNTGNANPPVDVAGQPWVNGPAHTIFTGYGNPAAGRKGFGGDSRGYVASRVDLTAFAGATVKPRFTMNTDNGVAYYGWAVDDITVYTCDLPQLRASAPKVAGKAKVGKRLTARPGVWAPAGVKLSYRWLRNGKAIPKATKRAYKLAKADQGKRISVRVTGSKSGYATKTVTSKRTTKVKKR